MISDTQETVLSILKSKGAQVPPAHWHTNTLASLFRGQFIAPRRGGQVGITSDGEAALKYKVYVKYTEWKAELRKTANWRRKARRGKR